MSLSILFVILAVIVFTFGIRIARHGFQRGMIAGCVALLFAGLRWGLHAYEGQQHAEAAVPPQPAEKSELYRLKSGAELQVRLAELRRRESDLLQRKSELEPGDHAGAQALTQEIAKYNEDLKPVLEQLKERPGLAQ